MGGFRVFIFRTKLWAFNIHAFSFFVFDDDIYVQYVDAFSVLSNMYLF